MKSFSLRTNKVSNNKQTVSDKDVKTQNRS